MSVSEGLMLLQERGMRQANEAAIYLAGRMRARTPRGAVQFLEMSRDQYKARVTISLVILDLYERIFPDQWARSSRPPFTTERELEFYILIRDHKFPLNLGPVESLPDWVFPGIPVVTQHNHDWLKGCEHPFEAQEPVFQLALALGNTHRGRNDWWPRLARLYGLPDTLRPAPITGVDTGRLLTAVDREPGPLRWLYQALLAVCYRTGNEWLDSHPLNRECQPKIVPWAVEEVERLAVEWRRARRVVTNLAALSEWLKQEPGAGIARAVALWNGAAEV